jgi:uncharacterized membrane protein YraQ (UPF0718 family)
MDPIVRPPLGAVPLTGEGEASSLARRGPSRRALASAGALFGVVAVAGVTWAKWYPYAGKLGKLWDTRAWAGSSILATGGVATRSAPSWHAAWAFAVAYGQDIWVALVAAIVIAAAMEALVPRERAASFFTRRSTLGGTLVAGLVAVPAMMCTCCSAPLTVTLKRSGVPTASALGFWLGNPVLNPAVLAFLALVAPWQWVVTRALVGAVLVLAVPTVVTRLVRAPTAPRTPSSAAAPFVPEAAGEPFDLRRAPRRFLTAIGRLGITLVPEYFVVVLLIGAFRGWLMPLGADTVHWGLLAVLVAAVAGVLIVIPTAGEIPILLGLAAVGTSPAVLGALLIALPAISLPSMAMVGRSLTWRVVGAAAVAVAVFALAGAGLLSALR